MGLMFPEDLAAWRRWQAGRNPLRTLRRLGRATPAPALVLHVRGGEPAALFAVDAVTPTAIASIGAPLAHLGDTPAAVLAPADVSAHLPGQWKARPVGSGHEMPDDLRGVRAVVALGHFLPAGAAAHHWAGRLGARFLVVQHGLLAPHMAPLPHGAHLLAFSDHDAAFWISGRSGITHEAIGSELLWNANRSQRTWDTAAAPVFLGQLHGAELPRRISAATAARFCRETGGTYRPHPAENDTLSRHQHAIWRRQGIQVSADAQGILDNPRPVVSIFSTGILEAAAAGIPSWVTCVRPPAWVNEFWERYRLAPWGEAPTEAPPIPQTEPAAAVAARVLATAKGTL